MRTNPDTPVDPLGSLGPAIKPAAPSKPDPVREFSGKPHELIGDTNTAVQTIVDTLRRKQNDRDEDLGCDLSDAYSLALLGCI